jgi:hypothetical protein
MASRKLTLKRKLKLMLELQRRDSLVPDDQRDEIEDSFKFKHIAEIQEESRHD